MKLLTNEQVEKRAVAMTRVVNTYGSNDGTRFVTWFAYRPEQGSYLTCFARASCVFKGSEPITPPGMWVACRQAQRQLRIFKLPQWIKKHDVFAVA